MTFQQTEMLVLQKIDNVGQTCRTGCCLRNVHSAQYNVHSAKCNVQSAKRNVHSAKRDAKRYIVLRNR